MIEIVKAPAYLTIQDEGFRSMRSIGLPRSGAADLFAHRFANDFIGNPSHSPTLEWALSGGKILFHTSAKIVFTGATVAATVHGNKLENETVIDVRGGDSLEVERITKGRFAYIGISPPLKIAKLFGSSSTYLPAALGGFDGRRLRTGDKIELGGESSEQSGSAPPDRPDYESDTLRIIPGPQSDLADGKLLEYLLRSTFTISALSDRAGFRLDAPPLAGVEIPEILSEPVCEGAIELPNQGGAIVLLADGPTIGGYAKPAVVISADIPILVQKVPGEKIRFAMK